MNDVNTGTRTEIFIELQGKERVLRLRDCVTPQREMAMDWLVIYTVKVTRIMILWIALYVLDKIWQDAYVRSWIANERDGTEENKPPPMWMIVFFALGGEALALLVVLLILILFSNLVTDRAGAQIEAFGLDANLFKLLGIDYILCTVLFLVVGVFVARMAQNCRTFRFEDDGMRGIRATCNLLLGIAAAVIALPLFLIVARPTP